MIIRNSPLRLLNPGPVTLSPRVRQALSGPDLCHRQAEFGELQQAVRSALAAVYPQAAHDYEAVLLTGSGTAAVEAMLGSLLPPGQHSLVVANGIYGERIADMLTAHGNAFTLIRSCWEAPLDLAAVGRALDQHPRPSRVITVQHETTTGRANDLAALGGLCRAAGVPLLVDAVSSFGGEGLDFDGWNIEACAATGNKCLHGAPGIAFVLARREALTARRAPARSVYLDLYAHHAAQAHGIPAFTPAIPILYALREALGELREQGGWQARHTRYVELSTIVRAGLQRKGYQRLLRDPAALSSSLTAFRLPPAMTFETLYETLFREGFVLYAGQQRLYREIFRIAVMGDLHREDLESLVDVFPAI